MGRRRISAAEDRNQSTVVASARLISFCPGGPEELLVVSEHFAPRSRRPPIAESQIDVRRQVGIPPRPESACRGPPSAAVPANKPIGVLARQSGPLRRQVSIGKADSRDGFIARRGRSGRRRMLRGAGVCGNVAGADRDSSSIAQSSTACNWLRSFARARGDIKLISPFQQHQPGRALPARQQNQLAARRPVKILRLLRPTGLRRARGGGIPRQQAGRRQSPARSAAGSRDQPADSPSEGRLIVLSCLGFATETTGSTHLSEKALHQVPGLTATVRVVLLQNCIGAVSRADLW